MVFIRFQEYSAEMHAISRKEKGKSHVGSMDGITMTSHSIRNNNPKPVVVATNNGPAPGATAVNNTAAPTAHVQR